MIKVLSKRAAQNISASDAEKIRQEDLQIFCAALIGTLSTNGQGMYGDAEPEVLTDVAREFVRMAHKGSSDGFANLKIDTKQTLKTK